MTAEGSCLELLSLQAGQVGGQRDGSYDCEARSGLAC